MLTFIIDVINITFTSSFVRITVVSEVMTSYSALFQLIHNLDITTSCTITSLGIIGHFITSNDTLCLTVIYLNIATCVTMTSLLIIEYILTNDCTVVCFVYNLHITMTFGFTSRTVIDNIIAFNILLWRSNSRTPIEFHLVGLTVVGTIIRMHHFTLSSLDNRLTDDVNKSCLCVTMCLWRCNTILRRKHNYVTKEVGIVCFCIVIALIGNNRITIVNQRTTSTKVISNL